MKKFLFCLVTLFMSSNLFASEQKKIIFENLTPNNFASSEQSQVIEQSKDIDACCHQCRISKNRKRKHTVYYMHCNNDNCKKNFCIKCISKDDRLFPGENSCVVCREECCCSFEVCYKDYADKDHKHCYTYKRTQKRHEKKPSMKVYKKKKMKDKTICIEELINPTKEIEIIEVEEAINPVNEIEIIEIAEEEISLNQEATQYTNYASYPYNPYASGPIQIFNNYHSLLTVPTMMMQSYGNFYTSPIQIGHPSEFLSPIIQERQRKERLEQLNAAAEFVCFSESVYNNIEIYDAAEIIVNLAERNMNH